MMPFRSRPFAALCLESRLVPAFVSYFPELLLPPPPLPLPAIENAPLLQFDMRLSPSPELIREQVLKLSKEALSFRPDGWLFHVPSAVELTDPPPPEARPPADPDFAPAARFVEGFLESADPEAERIAADIASRMPPDLVPFLDLSIPERNAPAPLPAKAAPFGYFHAVDGPLPEPAAVRFAAPHSTVAAPENDGEPAVENPPTSEPTPLPEIRESVALPAAVPAQSQPGTVWKLLPSAGEIALDIAALEASAGRLVRQLAEWQIADGDAEIGWDRGLVFSAAFVGLAGVGCALRSNPPQARRLRLPPVSTERDSHDDPSAGG